MSGQVVLKRKSVAAIRGGHPWIFSGAIQKTIDVDDESAQVLIRDADGGVLGHGLYSPQSQIRVRMYERTDAEQLEALTAAFFAKKIAAARKRRERFGLPSQETTGYRVVNSEGDGLPGLVVDRWEDLLVFQLTTLALVRHREVLIEGLREVFSDVGQLALMEAEAPVAMAQREGFSARGGWVGEHRPETVEFRELDLHYSIGTGEFQKTGHYADMRPHREWFSRTSEGRRIFDGFCYTGAFGLLAAKRGAARVVCVDSSARAIEAVERNAERNGLEQVEARRGKVDDALRSAFDRGERFDGVVLDPPKLAPRRKHVAGALKVYESLVIQAARLLEPGGLLALGSCSEAIGPEELERVLSSCASRLGRAASVVYLGTQPPDHPVVAGMREGRYLTFLAGQILY
jgi:23S rRNA (cytosine1962-C5)-methyltransferase